MFEFFIFDDYYNETKKYNMKKTILSIIAVIGFSTLSVAQIEIYKTGTSTDISGSELVVQAWNGQEHHNDFYIVNSTQMAQNWNVTRVKINENPNWSDYICWGPQGGFGNCYPASGMTATSWATPSNDAPNVAVGDTAKLSSYITPDYSVSSANEIYRYYVGTDQNPKMDSVDVRLVFVVGLDEVTPTLSVNIAPNPSNEYFVVSATGTQASSIKVVDVLGNVILSEKMTTASKKVDVTAFRNGVYFVIIESDEAKPVTKRIVVRH